MALPQILICATPVYGHVMPLRAIGRSLIQRNYSVTFLTGSDFRSAVEATGATFIPLAGEADLTARKVEEGWRGVDAGDPAGLRMGEDADWWEENLISQFESVKLALKNMGDGEIVVLTESWFKGVLPMILDAERPENVKGFIGVGIIPLAVSSVDSAPFGRGIAPDSSAEGKKRNRKLHNEDQLIFGGIQQKFQEVLRSLGAKSTELFVRDAIYHLANRFVQMCTPSFEYPRSDAPKSIIFTGGLPVGLRDPLVQFPEWWGDITGKGNKKVIFVAQGTVSMAPTDLIVPTMTALSERDDIIVVVALGKKGLKLPEDIQVPANARVADFLPYDEILEFTDCFVSNGGYGAIQHGLGHGVPQIVAGVAADKAENCARLGWSGVGLNLQTDKPSAQTIRCSVEYVLGNDQYRRRAKEIQAEMLQYDPIGVIIESIDVVAKG